MTIPSFWPQRRPAAVADAVLGQTGKETLCFPLLASGRLAMIDLDLQASPNARAFHPGDYAALREYGPESLALSLCEALALTDAKLRGRLELPTLKFAIVVFTSLDDGLMTSHHRDLLWKAFGVPVFEQLRDWDGAVIARECEVHDGLHLTSETDFTGYEAEITRDHCDCGQETPRLRNLQAAPKVHSAAA